MTNIACSQCGDINKSAADYYFNSDDGRIVPCRDCIKKNNASYYEKNKTKVSERKISHYNNNREKVLTKVKTYQEANKDKLSSQKKIYYQNNRTRLIEKQRKYNAKSMRNFYANHKDDPEYKLRKNLSFSISNGLKRNGSFKNRKSILDFLPYSIQELKEHLEKQFEPWMTWENWGAYRLSSWKDDDITTWSWQLDHIIPHSTFHYSSMNDKEFFQCWALENLRPLSAKINHSDGVNRIRHNQ